MTRQYDFDWQLPVPEDLLTGQLLDRVDEDGSVIEAGCLVKVDTYGFFIHWTSDGKEGQVIECSQISDIRYDLTIKPGESHHNAGSQDSISRVVCVCSGLDFVNINYTYFLAPDIVSAERWLKSLRRITHNYKSNNVCPMTQLQKHWLKLRLMVNVNRNIPVRSITRTFASGKTEKIVMQALEELGLPGGKNDEIEPNTFTFEKFVALYHKICPRQDIVEIFKEISYHKNHITASQLIEFLNESQRDPRLNEILYPHYDRARVKQLVARYETDENFKEKDWLSYEGFCRYLMSDENAPVFLDRLDICQEMDHPLNHYYINSSHNTYLVGMQFGGRSSVEMYRQVLIAGCRCVELDCWDGPNGEPIITHGKAMCSDINFRDVILAIKETAFVSSDYPVILSFENHCSKHQQLFLAKYCESIFGDMLLKVCLPDVPLKPGVPLPSPNQLKRKILIKNKRLKSDVEKEQMELFLKGLESQIEKTDTSGDVDGEDLINGREDVNANLSTLEEAHPEQRGRQESIEESTYLEMKEKLDSEKEKESQKVVSKSTADCHLSRGSSSEQPCSSSTAQSSIDVEDEAAQMMATYQYISATTNVHPYLSCLVNYVQPVKFQGFKVADERTIHFNMSSFNENTGLGLLKNHALELVNYNKRQMSRIYPKGGRVDSSNYMPQIFWNAGCQMVSLNFQTPDLAMQLNQGKFEYNGNCGYLLKPDFMRRPDREFDPFSECTVDGVIAAHCSVQVISGQFLSDKKVGTYVEVDMFGLPTDTIRKEYKTKVVANNGLNPVYNADPFVFRKIVLPDLAVLRIAVCEESGRLIGQRILPLDGLQAGYRHISLRTEGNFPLSLPTVFCRITLKTYIQDGFEKFVEQLSDPRKFLTESDQRAQQMKVLGIDENEIGEVPAMSGTSSNGGTRPKHTTANRNSQTSITATPSRPPFSTQASIKPSKEALKKESNIKYEEISIDQLKLSKPFTKALKNELKEIALLQKKHEKEKIASKKVHLHGSQKAKGRSSFKKKGSSILLCHRSTPYEMNNLPKSHSESEVLSLAHTTNTSSIETTSAWQSMVQRHDTELFKLRTNHLDKQYLALKSLLLAAHEGKKKELLATQKKEQEELTSTQTKTSLETRKSFHTEKANRSKAETDRMLKEVTENNAKRFIDEREQQTQRHKRQQDYLQKAQLREVEKLTQYCEQVKGQVEKEHNQEVVEKIETVI